MRRLLPIIATAALLVAACTEGSTDTTAAAPTTTAETTTTAPVETTTAVPQETTSTTTAETTTTVGEPIYTVASGTPPAELDSFSATMDMDFDLGEVTIGMQSDGVWTSDGFSCTTAVDMAGLGIEQHAVATPYQLWLDTGFGFQVSSLLDPDAVAVIEACPTSPLFWEELGLPEGIEDLPWEADTVNGIPARRIDLTSEVDAFAGVGLIPEMEGLTFDTFTVWVSEDGSYALALDVAVTVDEETLEELGVPAEFELGDSGQIAMRFELADVNDPDLVIDLPQ